MKTDNRGYAMVVSPRKKSPNHLNSSVISITKVKQYTVDPGKTNKNENQQPPRNPFNRNKWKTDHIKFFTTNRKKWGGGGASELELSTFFHLSRVSSFFFPIFLRLLHPKSESRKERKFDFPIRCNDSRKNPRTPELSALCRIRYRRWINSTWVISAL